MPRRAPRPCLEPTCRELVRGRSGRCDPCEAKRHRRIDDRRGSSSARGYGYQWQKLRLTILADEPLCRTCDAADRTTAATEVDHIDGDSANNDRANLRPLCKPCHSARTARDQAFGRKGTR